MAGFENIKNSPRITTIYSKQKQKDKFSMFSVLSNKSNMRQYFCQNFLGLLLVNDLNFPLPPSPTKKTFGHPCTIFFFFHCFSLSFCQKFKIKFHPLQQKKASYATDQSNSSKLVHVFFRSKSNIS